ncbi:3D domain-containing protein [Oceanobacillus massiliensis]|uniref:PcsB-like coiled-coil domain-containing protein n=1 Tax=Oceanobacillus massiliensis TaxID=1465765 RepID=UPI0030166430
MRKILARLSAIALIAGLGGSLMSVPVYAEANLDDIHNQREEIRDTLSESEKEIAAILTDLDNLNEEIAAAHDELAKNEKLVADTEDNIEVTLDDISKLEKEMKELEKTIEERYEILKNRIVSTQKNGGKISYLEVIFGAKSFDDFISRVTAVNQIANSDAALIEKQEADIQELEDKRNQVMDKLNDLNELKADQEETKDLISQQLEQNDQRKAALENKNQELMALANELEMEDSDLALLEKEVNQKLIAKAEAEKAEKEAAAKEAEMKTKEAEPAKTKVASVQTKPDKQAEQKEKTSTKPAKQEQAGDKQEKPKEKEETSEGKSFTVTSTAFTADCAGCSGVTATGINLKDNPDSKVIAVDPSVIPLGSVVLVEGYGYAIAGDTGGAINGNKIDVFVPTKAEAAKWGVRTVKVTIVN